MLKKLKIEQFVIIDKLDLDLQSGLTILTGETGAGLLFDGFKSTPTHGQATGGPTITYDPNASFPLAGAALLPDDADHGAFAGRVRVGHVGAEHPGVAVDDARLAALADRDRRRGHALIMTGRRRRFG